MSNYLAIATVTATLRYLLLKTLPPDLSGAQVTTLRPDAQLSTVDAAGINIFLYQVTPNATLRNADLPSRRADGSLVQRPQLALDLHYLLTFYGSDLELEPQRLLGNAATTLHVSSVLSTGEIQQALANSAPFNAAPFLQAPFNAPPFQPDLGLQAERVKLTPVTLSLEDLSKLWSVFYQIPFALTMAYTASVVLLERGDLTPQAGLPVKTRSVTAVPLNQAAIMSIALASDATKPIVAGSTILLTGSGLRGADIAVQFANQDALVAPSTMTDTQLTVTLPAALPAGPQGVQVVQTVLLGSPGTAHVAARSSTAAFVLHPTITPPVTGNSTAVTVTVNPSARAGQRVTLLLNEATSPPPIQPAAYVFALGPLAADAATLTFPLTGVTKTLTYFVRLQVDGAESPLELDPASATFGPTAVLA